MPAGRSTFAGGVAARRAAADATPSPECGFGAKGSCAAAAAGTCGGFACEAKPLAAWALPAPPSPLGANGSSANVGRDCSSSATEPAEEAAVCWRGCGRGTDGGAAAAAAAGFCAEAAGPGADRDRPWPGRCDGGAKGSSASCAMYETAAANPVYSHG